jgi:hypothetical protein
LRNASLGAGASGGQSCNSKAGGTISQQAAVHPWLAADAHVLQQQQQRQQQRQQQQQQQPVTQLFAEL